MLQPARAILSDIPARLGRLLPEMGIAARLGFSFCIVGVLAVVANLSWQRGVSIVETTRTYTPDLSARSQAAPTPKPLTAPQATANVLTLNDVELLDALTQLDRVVLQRAQTRTAENDLLWGSASRQLEAVVVSFLHQAALTQDNAGPVRTQARGLRSAAEQLIQLSDARRECFSRQSMDFEAVDALLKDTLDHNWTIFGRVLARQSILSMSRNLDEIRRQMTQLGASGGYGADTLSALAKSESQFSVTLEHNSSGLARAQGAAWIARLRQSAADLTSQTTRLIELEGRASSAAELFESRVRSFASLVRSATNDSKLRLPPSNTPAATSIAAAPTSSAQELAPPSPTVRVFRREARTTGSQPRRELFAALSAGVLVLLLLTTVATVQSVWLPIKQFMHTANRLANGEAAARFPRGGLKELDTLALSLNSMAANLEKAQTLTREYQGALELRIEERTQQLQRLSEHDLLTGLPNRKRLLQELAAVLYEVPPQRSLTAVVFVDLDNFKNLNDSMGHTLGDRVLRAAGLRLSEVVGSGAIIARLGGDEFGVLFPSCGSIEEIETRAKNLLAGFKRPLSVEGRELRITVSAGASIHPIHASTSEALLSAADAALFHSKSCGRDQLTLFKPELLERATARFNTEQSLRRALEHDEFELVFQPEVSARTGEVCLVEALLRWRLPGGQRVSPLQFLSTAEESGLILQIGDWVLRSAIESAAGWQRGRWPQVRVAINVSPSQLLSEGFARRLRDLLLQHNLPPHCIEIELTETALQTGASCVNTLRELREIGVGVALDDFGTGFSSLASLQNLPLTRVKLDQSLIANIDRDAKARAIATAIITLCAELGLEVTAEGIERPEQLAALLDRGAITLQGYLFSRPVAATQLEVVVSTMPERLYGLILESSVRRVPPDPAAPCAAIEFWATNSA